MIRLEQMQIYFFDSSDSLLFIDGLKSVSNQKSFLRPNSLSIFPKIFFVGDFSLLDSFLTVLMAMNWSQGNFGAVRLLNANPFPPSPILSLLYSSKCYIFLRDSIPETDIGFTNQNQLNKDVLVVYHLTSLLSSCPLSIDNLEN